MHAEPAVSLLGRVSLVELRSPLLLRYPFEDGGRMLEMSHCDRKK
jgi:hypothetical protein